MGHNARTDKRFVAYVSCSFALAWLLMFFFLWLCFLPMASEWFWTRLWAWRATLVSFCIYEGVILFLVPRAYGKVVLNKNNQTRLPHLHFIFLFAWEVFYFPQVFISLALNVLYSMSI